MTLLQIVAETAATTPPAEQSISLLELVARGGWVMFPIGFLALVSVYLIVERFITINRASKVDSGFLTNVKTMLLDGKIDAALSVCRSSNTPIARLLEKGIKRLGKPVKEIESAVENTGKLEIYKLEKNLSYLGIIAGIAPMLGFIGTISGVINIFYKISISADFGIQQISDGLYEKMVTSAAGLMVGIIAHIGFHLLNTMIDRVTFQLESTTVDFIDLIQEPGK
jgi:biopolymer transport protein ExbB